MAGKKWSEEDIEFLKKNSKTMSLEKLSKALNKGKRTIMTKRKEFNLPVCRQWTHDEDEYLEANWGFITMKSIGKKINRSDEAVRNRAYILGLRDALRHREDILQADFVRALGINPSTIYYWIEKGLKVKSKKVGGATKKHNKFIDVNEFWNWAEQNKNIVNFSKFEKNMLGEEPGWVEVKRKSDTVNPARVNWNRSWKQQDVYLLGMVKANKYTLQEIATSLNRTETAILARLRRLKIKLRPLQEENTSKRWSNEEKTELKKLLEEGYDSNYISKKLKRSRKAIDAMASRI